MKMRDVLAVIGAIGTIAAVLGLLVLLVLFVAAVYRYDPFLGGVVATIFIGLAAAAVAKE